MVKDKVNILRKIFLGLLGAFLSEILFTSMTVTELAFDLLTLGIYFFSFALMDELVQKYNLGNRAIFYLGAVFGLILEGFFAYSIPENPFFMILFISILWHGLITVLASFIITDIFFHRKSRKDFNKIWIAISIVGSLFLLFYFGITTFSVIISAALVYILVVLIILLFLYLTKREIKKNIPYQHKPKIGIFLLIVGFILGTLLQVTGEEVSYKFLDHLLRILFFIIIFSLVIYRLKTKNYKTTD